MNITYDAILDTEAQLVALVWSSDEDGGHWGTAHNAQLHPGLALQPLPCKQLTVK